MALKLSVAVNIRHRGYISCFVLVPRPLPSPSDFYHPSLTPAPALY